MTNTLKMQSITEENHVQKEEIESSKKRKIQQENMKKCTKNTNFCQESCKNKLFLGDENLQKKLFVKVLLSANKTIPNTIAILDKIIEERASTCISSSLIYSSALSTYGEIDHVIDLTARKDKLLNIYVMGKELLESLSGDLKDIAVLRYQKRYQVDDIVLALNSSQRTIYRKLKLIDEKLVRYMNLNNWNISFLEDQISSEPWLKSLYEKKYNEELVNMSRAECKKKNPSA